MAVTPIRGLQLMAGSDPANTIDNSYDAAINILDAAAFYSRNTFANRGSAITAKRGTFFEPTDIPGTLYVSNGTDWIEVAPGMGTAPIGASMEWWAAGDPADTRWVKMDGRALSTTTYAGLYALLGNAFDTMDGQLAPGAGQFRIPKVAGRAVIGAGAGNGLTTRTLGSSGGEERHALSVGEMAAHDHGAAGTHSHGGGTTGSDGAHAHSFGGGQVPDFTAGFTGVGVLTGNTTAFVPSWSGGLIAITATNQGGAHQHSIGADGSHTHASVGSGSSHENMQPWVAANRIIRIA